MRRLIGLALLLFVVSGCVRSEPPVEPPSAVRVAAIELVSGLLTAEVLRTADPLGTLQRGEVSVALIRGPVPAQWEGFTYSVSEQVVMQGWLDAPRSLTRAEAEALLSQLGPPGEAAPGVLARGRLADLRPGWRAVPVDGVAPTPASVWSGEYPIAGLLSVVYRPGSGAPTRAVVAELRGRAATATAPWVRLTVAGDIMLARGVERAMQEHGTLYPVLQVKERLASADLAFANLESPIGVKGKALPGKQIWFRAPPSAVELLKTAGLDAVAVANNHILDYDTENFLETLDYLDEAGIRYVGGGTNLAQARQPLVLEAKGIRIAFLAYSEFADLFFDWDYPRSFAATETVPGVAGIDDHWLAEDIRAARAQADLVAIAFHWGEEFQNHPTHEQRRLARLSIDLGADLVLGYHPHAIQGFEIYRDRFIAYSTGNFIMDRQDTDLARESMLLDFELSSSGVRSVTVHPVWIEAEQPQILSGERREQLLDKMREISGWRRP